MLLFGKFVLLGGASLVGNVHVLSIFLRLRLDRRLDEISAMISLYVTDLRPWSFVNRHLLHTKPSSILKFEFSQSPNFSRSQKSKIIPRYNITYNVVRARLTENRNGNGWQGIHFAFENYFIFVKTRFSLAINSTTGEIRFIIKFFLDRAKFNSWKFRSV